MKCEPGCSGREEGQLRGVVLELEEEQCSSSPSVPALPCPVLAESPVLLWPVSPLTLLEIGILKQGPFTAPWFCDFALAGGVGVGGNSWSDSQEPLPGGARAGAWGTCSDKRAPNLRAPPTPCARCPRAQSSLSLPCAKKTP